MKETIFGSKRAIKIPEIFQWKMGETIFFFAGKNKLLEGAKGLLLLIHVLLTVFKLPSVVIKVQNAQEPKCSLSPY